MVDQPDVPRAQFDPNFPEMVTQYRAKRVGVARPSYDEPVLPSPVFPLPGVPSSGEELRPSTLCGE